MKYCALICHDKPDALEIRKATRQAHLDYIATLGDMVKFAGFFYDEDEKPNGSLIVLEVSSLQEAEKIASNDPYKHAGLFDKVDIKPWHWTINAPA